MTSTLTVGQFDARYHSVRLGEAEELDRALSHMLTTELSGAVAQRLSSTDAEVCIPDLHIAIDVADPHNIRQVAQLWAAEVLDAITKRAASSLGVVVYHHRIDALVDLVASVWRGNHDRLWAWKQVGLVSSDVSAPTSDHVTRALLANLDVVPGVLRCLAPRMQVRMEPQEWVRLAVAVDQFLGPILDAAVHEPRSIHSPPNPVERALAWKLPWEVVDQHGQLCLARLVTGVSNPTESASYTYISEVARRCSHQLLSVRPAKDNVTHRMDVGSEPTDSQSAATPEASGRAANDIGSLSHPPSDDSTTITSNHEELGGLQQIEAPHLSPVIAAPLSEEPTIQSTATATANSSEELDEIEQVEALGSTSTASPNGDLAVGWTIDPPDAPPEPSLERVVVRWPRVHHSLLTGNGIGRTNR